MKNITQSDVYLKLNKSLLTPSPSWRVQMVTFIFKKVGGTVRACFRKSIFGCKAAGQSEGPTAFAHLWSKGSLSKAELHQKIFEFFFCELIVNS